LTNPIGARTTASTASARRSASVQSQGVTPHGRLLAIFPSLQGFQRTRPYASSLVFARLGRTPHTRQEESQPIRRTSAARRSERKRLEHRAGKLRHFLRTTIQRVLKGSGSCATCSNCGAIPQIIFSRLEEFKSPDECPMLYRVALAALERNRFVARKSARRRG
jgi:hypothetical protein